MTLTCIDGDLNSIDVIWCKSLMMGMKLSSIVLRPLIENQRALNVGRSRLNCFVQVLLVFFLLISYPISKVLDYMLGTVHSALLRRAEPKTFVDFHGNEARKGVDLTHYETRLPSLLGTSIN